MTISQLPNIRMASTASAIPVTLSVIGARLRSQYDHVLHQPVPPDMEKLLRQLL